MGMWSRLVQDFKPSSSLAQLPQKYGHQGFESDFPLCLWRKPLTIFLLKITGPFWKLFGSSGSGVNLYPKLLSFFYPSKSMAVRRQSFSFKFIEKTKKTPSWHKWSLG